MLIHIEREKERKRKRKRKRDRKRRRKSESERKREKERRGIVHSIRCNSKKYFPVIYLLLLLTMKSLLFPDFVGGAVNDGAFNQAGYF